MANGNSGEAGRGREWGTARGEGGRGVSQGQEPRREEADRTGAVRAPARRLGGWEKKAQGLGPGKPG